MGAWVGNFLWVWFCDGVFCLVFFFVGGLWFFCLGFGFFFFVMDGQ